MHLLIPAAGSGRRMGADRNKLLIPLLDKPILAWTLAAAAAAKTIEWIGVIGQPADWPSFEQILSDFSVDVPVVLIEGGSTRQESVAKGVDTLIETQTAHQVLIHDGARCLATPDLFDRCTKALTFADSIITAIPVKDTIKQVSQSQNTTGPLVGLCVETTPNRQQLWAAQTPQGFHLKQLAAAHSKALSAGWEVTDDASLFESMGLPVEIVAGEETNLKITTPHDLAIATEILSQRC